MRPKSAMANLSAPHSNKLEVFACNDMKEIGVYLLYYVGCTLAIQIHSMYRSRRATAQAQPWKPVVMARKQLRLV